MTLACRKALTVFLSVALAARHASPPLCRTNVFIDKRRATTGRHRRQWERVSTIEHCLTVPAPPDWHLDTVRAVLLTLRQFLPAHDIADAEGRIDLYQPSGRRHAILAVRVFHLEAVIYVPALNSTEKRQPENQFSPPMLAALADLKARSPLAIATMQPVAMTTADMSADEQDRTALARALLAPTSADFICDSIRTMLAKFPPDKRYAIRTLLLHELNSQADEDGADDEAVQP